MNAIVYILAAIAAIGIFFLMREVYCWYFKINKLVEQNDRIIYLLDEIVAKMGEE